MAAQRAPILDLGAGTLAVSGQLQQAGSRLVAGAGRRVIALNSTTVAALREHGLWQQAERAAAGTRWPQTGHVFTTPAGKTGDVGQDGGEEDRHARVKHRHQYPRPGPARLDPLSRRVACPCGSLQSIDALWPSPIAVTGNHA